MSAAGDFTHCKPITGQRFLGDGWGCCNCRGYNGELRKVCKHCGHVRCGVKAVIPGNRKQRGGSGCTR